MEDLAGSWTTGLLWSILPEDAPVMLHVTALIDVSSYNRESIDADQAPGYDMTRLWSTITPTRQSLEALCAGRTCFEEYDG